jgi:hypothetical protein
MSSVKNPPAKKRNELARDHRTAMEAPHAFRKNWPKKKALANRRTRRRAADQLSDLRRGGDPDGFSSDPNIQVLSKQGTAALGQHVQDQLANRIDWTGAQYTRTPYDPVSAAAFRRCVLSLVEGRRGRARDYGRWLLSILDDEHKATSTPWYQQRWMRKFLAEHGDMERRIRAWALELGLGAGRPTRR